MTRPLYERFCHNFRTNQVDSYSALTIQAVLQAQLNFHYIHQLQINELYGNRICCITKSSTLEKGVKRKASVVALKLKT